VNSIFLFTILCANELPSQTTTSGGLTGIITDQSGAVIPYADVELKDEAKGRTQSTKTDREGVYRFFYLPPGRYVLTVEHVGFQQEKRAVEVQLGPPDTVNITLPIARASNAIKVTRVAPIINAENGDVSSTINEKQISELPNPGNDLTYIAQSSPGAIMNTDVQGLANFSIQGMPGTSYLYTIDGINETDNGINLSRVGVLNLFLGQNEIEEATVVSTGYSSQFGGAAGGNINYVTKSGTNESHGNAQYYWNGQQLNANDWLLKATGKPRPPDTANQWAASIGGPIKKNVLFYFADTEGLRILIPQVSLVTIPSPQFEAATLANIDSTFGANSASHGFYNQIFDVYNNAPGARTAIPGGFSSTDPLGCTGFSGPDGLGTSVPCSAHFTSDRGRPSYDMLASARLDWIPGSADRVFFRLQDEVGRGALVTDPISSHFDVDAVNSPWWQGELMETHAFGSSAASQFIVAGTYQAQRYQDNNPSQAPATFPTTLFFQQGPFTTLAGALWAQLIEGASTQFQVSDDVTKFSGPNRLGFGIRLERFFETQTTNAYNASGYAFGQLDVQTLNAFFYGGVDFASPATDFTLLSQSFSQQDRTRVSFLNFSFYGQDEWRARTGLTLTLGLRAEHYGNPVCRIGCFARLATPFAESSHDPEQPYDQAILVNQRTAFQEMDNVLWAPRFSFAWQPFGVSRNMVIRGGMGLFYDPIPSGILSSFSGNSPLHNLFNVFGDNLAPNEQTNLFKDAADSNQSFLTAFASGQTLSQIQEEIPNFSPPALNAAPRKIHFAQYQRWSLEWQQAFGTHTSLDIGYFGYHGIHGLYQNANVNAFGFGSLPAGPCTSPPVPPCSDPRFSQVLEFDTSSLSNYNGLTVSFQRRFGAPSSGLLQINYTYGHAFDEVSNGGLLTFTSAGITGPQDPNNLRGAYGPAEYDVRHSLNANYLWEPPLKKLARAHGPDGLTNGWQVSGTVFFRTGFPYPVVDFGMSGSLLPNNFYGILYAVPTQPGHSGHACGKKAAVTAATMPCLPPQTLPGGAPNPESQFLQVGCETGFNVGHLPGTSGPCNGPTISIRQERNSFRGPGYFNTDLGIMKNTKMPGWANARFGVGLQFFNLLNHPNFGFPDTSISSPTFGQILGMEQPPTSILGSGRGGDASPRMIQVKAQLQF
jgi:hypothetical protein